MANNGVDNGSRVSVDIALIVTGTLIAFLEVLRVGALIATGHDDPTLTALVNTLIVPFVGIISADRLGNIVAKIRAGESPLRKGKPDAKG